MRDQRVPYPNESDERYKARMARLDNTESEVNHWPEEDGGRARSRTRPFRAFTHAYSHLPTSEQSKLREAMEKHNPNRPSWDEYFFGIVEAVSKRSEDPDTKVGCIIVDQDHRIVSTGYNSLPAGASVTEFPLTRPEKYDNIIHADMNALLFAERHRLDGSTMYVPFLPCFGCAKHLVQVGVSEVVYATDYRSLDFKADHDMAVKLMQIKNVKLRKYNG